MANRHPMLLSRVLFGLSLVLLAALTLAGCSGGGPVLDAARAKASAPAVQPAFPWAPLGTKTASSYSPGERFLGGTEHLPWVNPAHVHNVIDFPTGIARFLPNSVADPAYAVYKFQFPSGYSETDQDLYLSWQSTHLPLTKIEGQPPVIELYVGLANWSRMHWDWFPVTDINHIDIADLAPYIYPTGDERNGELLVTIVVTKSTAMPVNGDLNWLRFGPDLPPSGQASASATSGCAPFKVLFSAAALDANDDAPMQSIEWDFDGDGVFEFYCPDPTATISHTFTSPGIYTVTLQIRDSHQPFSDPIATAQDRILIYVQPHP